MWPVHYGRATLNKNFMANKNNSKSGKMKAKDLRRLKREQSNTKTQPSDVRKHRNQTKRQKRVDDAIHLIARVSDSINVDINATINERSRHRKTSKVQKPTDKPTVKYRRARRGQGRFKRCKVKAQAQMQPVRPVVPAPAPAPTRVASVKQTTDTPKKGKHSIWKWACCGLLGCGAVGAGIWWWKKRS